MLTERDLNILKFVNQFGFSNTAYVTSCLFSNNSEKTAYYVARRRIAALYKKGLLKKQDNIIGVEEVFTLSQTGSKILTDLGIDELRKLERINWGEFNHDSEIQKVYLRFRELGFTRFYSERKAKEHSPFGDLIPDLVMIRDDNKALMIEVELTRKSFKRMEEKLKQYSSSNLVKKLVYICKTEAIKKAIFKTCDKFPKLRSKFDAVTLEEFYSIESSRKLLSWMGRNYAQ